MSVMYVLILMCFISACDDGDIRLSGGSESNGTVEICFNSVWGLISVSGWGEKDAEVTCSQLGFLREGEVAKCKGIESR